jgi:diacylglycerol kinase (ATP)
MPDASSGVRVILNPAAGQGRGGKREAELRSAFAAVGVTEVWSTRVQGDEQTLTARAIAEGARTIVAVGGDGTWSNVANAIIRSGADVRLALGSAGTGNDFAKTVGAPASDYAATARLAVHGPDTRVDVGRIEEKYFLNVAGFGFDIAVIEHAKRITWLKGDLVYTYAALRQLCGYKGIPIRVGSPGRPGAEALHLMLIIANGRNFGGKFRIAPRASLTDGRLDAIAIESVSPLRRIPLFAATGKGTHASRAEVRSESAPTFTLTFAAPPAYETDGEYNRAASATLEVHCVPRALRVVTPDSGLPA